ncbi:MAG: trypsin-like serine protease [Deltaproteobacteria bacterium]|nr:trypsin-like serine protease [Deltaproteobacteria bacterium]
MRFALHALASFALCTAACAAPTSTEDATEGDESEIVGGKPDQRWSASGYLVKGPSLDRIDASTVKCGATLIAPNVVVTAAHCVLADKAATWAFGTGDAGRGELVKVIATRVHPDFHEEAQGSIDLVHALRKYDLAMLTLERAVRGVTPATLPSDPPKMGCNIQAIGFSGATRVSTPACVMFRITLGRDPIFEVHPAENSALCIKDGDEGSSVVAREGAGTVLRGIFVGSVTQGFTDCKRGTQFLNGYESMYGYRDWLNEGIRAAAR